MGLFSKPKVPGIDTAALTRIAEENAAKQRQIVGGLRPGLAPISQNFQQQRTDLSARIPEETETRLGQLRTDLSGVGTAERAAADQATNTFRERQFRQVPELQRAIRESLGASGTTGNAAAVSQVARPIIDAATSARDFGADREQQILQNQSGREEGLATTGFGARTQAAEQRFGLDKDTVDYLTSIGREDLIREAEGFLGVEDQLGSNRLGIEQARQQNEIAKATAAASRRGNIISGLTQLGGAGLGFLAGGPAGAGLGAQIGGTAGQFINGSPVSFDPTLLYALGNRNKPTARTAVVNSLGGDVPTYSPTRRQMGY